MKDGFGSYEWPDGTKYEGNFKEDRKDGFGIYYFYNGDKYEGNFKEDRFHGNGTYQVSIKISWVFCVLFDNLRGSNFEYNYPKIRTTRQINAIISFTL